MQLGTAELIAAFVAMSGFCVWIVKWALARSEKIEERSYQNMQESAKAMAVVNESIAAVGASLARHDELNGIAHKEASQTLKQVAEILKAINKEE